MSSDPIDIQRIIRQQLESEWMLGVRDVPLDVDLALGAQQTEKRGATSPSSLRRFVASSRASSENESSTVSEAPRGLKPAARLDGPKGEILRVLDETRVRGCTACGLHATRTQTVFGQGNSDARLVFVGEAPGFEEDKKGLAFVGRAGELLTKMIGAMGLSRDDVFICNVLKCRPPQNRDPKAEETLACSGYLREQLSTIQPECIVALGSPAAKTLLNTTESIGKLRGRFHDYYVSGTTGVGASIPLMPTYHPAYLLRSPGEKGKTWADLQQVMARLDLPGS